MAATSTRYPPGTTAGLTGEQLAALDAAAVHTGAAPTAIDYVLDEVKATANAVAVYDGAASATLLNDTTTIGPGATTTGIRSVAVGSGAAAAEDGTAVGRNSSAGADGTALGAGAYSESGGTAVGFGADASGTEGTALGRASQTTGTAGTAVGYSAVSADGGVALGTASSAGAAGVAILGVADAGAIAIRGAANGTNAIALGQSATALGSCISIGVAADSAGGNSVALGTWARATGVQSTALGGGNSNTGANQGPVAAGDYAIAIGVGAAAPNNYDITIGYGSDGTGGGNGIAIGRAASATAANAVALGRATTASGANSIAIGWNASATASDAITIGASYLAGNMVTAKHLSPAAAVGVDLGTSTLPFGSLFAGLRVTDWAYQRYPTTGGNGGITTAAVTSTTGNVPVAFASGAGETAKATVSGFTNTGVLSVAAVPYQRTFFVIIRGLLRYNSPGGDGNNDRGAVLYIPGSSATTAFSVVAPQAKSQDGGYQHRTGAGFVTVLSGAAFTFTPRIASAGGLAAEVIQVEYFVLQV